MLTAKEAEISVSTGTSNQIASRQSYTPALSILTLLFFMWGFLTSLNDILVPHLKSIFGLSYKVAILVQVFFFLSYFVFAFPSGKLLENIGYKKTMVTGLVVMGIGSLLFVPAASIPSFPLFLSALTVLAAGITILQVAANPYVAVLGPESTASSRLNLTQGFNSLGTTVAPLLGSVVILAHAPRTVAEIHSLSPSALQIYRVQQASSVKLPYLALAATLLLLAAVIAAFKLPSLAGQKKTEKAGGESIWAQHRLLLGAAAIFFYVGAEVAIGSFLVSYISQPEIGGLSVQMAARYVSLYWGGAMIGRFIGSGLLQKIRAGALLGTFAVIAAMLVITSMLSFGHVAMVSILAVGLFNSIMFPSIFTLGIEGLGPLTGEGSGLLVCAIVGGAIIPGLQGVMADRIGIHHAFLLPVISYVYIAYFGFWCLRRSGATDRSGMPTRA